jgi:hypothetical protein
VRPGVDETRIVCSAGDWTIIFDLRTKVQSPRSITFAHEGDELANVIGSIRANLDFRNCRSIGGCGDFPQHAGRADCPHCGGIILARLADALIDNDFRKIPLGTYAPLAFWATAALFGSEHGPYWDVGFLMDIIYNLWMIRSKSLADCILMHGVMNGLLSVYVIVYSQWQYWQ